MPNIVELFTISTDRSNVDWEQVITDQHCPYINRQCIKTRKSASSIAIGTCSVRHGTLNRRELIICPKRFLESSKVFVDCLHLLTLHEPGNELHRVSEIEIPGGSVDYFIASVQGGKVVDFVGIELQALDTTGSLWPSRQAFLQAVGVDLDEAQEAHKPYGINWKMTAKTTLVQLHHKIETFEALNKHLVLVLQDDLLRYMRQEFNFAHIETPKIGNSMHFHAYSLIDQDAEYTLSLSSRASTDASGIASALGLQASAKVDLEIILNQLQSRISSQTLLKIV